MKKKQEQRAGTTGWCVSTLHSLALKVPQTQNKSSPKGKLHVITAAAKQAKGMMSLSVVDGNIRQKGMGGVDNTLSRALPFGLDTRTLFHSNNGEQSTSTGKHSSASMSIIRSCTLGSKHTCMLRPVHGIYQQHPTR